MGWRDRLAGGLFNDVGRKLASRLPSRVQALGRRARPAAELAGLDRNALKSWLRNVQAVEEALGPELEAQWTRLVLQAARHDARSARLVAWSVPEHLARVETAQRGEYLDTLELICERRPQALGVVARTLPELMEKLEGRALRSFLDSGLDLHTDSTQVAESFLRRESGRAREELERLALGLPLASISRTLALYARAHCGEDVQIRPAPQDRNQRLQAFSEGRHIYLPERVNQFGDERDFTVYRVLTARTAAYLEFGTFDLDLRKVDGPWPDRNPQETDLEQLLRAFPNRSLARDLFRVAEDARIEHHMVSEYPGLKRDLAMLRPEELQLRPDLADLAPVEQLVEALLQWTWGGDPRGGLDPAVAEQARQAWTTLSALLETGPSVEDVAGLIPSLYAHADALLIKVQDEDLNPVDPETGEPRRPVSVPDLGGGEDPDRGEGEYGGLEDSSLGSGVRPELLSEEEREAEEHARGARAAMEEEGLEHTLSEIRRALSGQALDDGRSYEEMVAFLERYGAPEGGLVEQSEDDEPEQGPAIRRRGEPGQQGPLDEDARANTIRYPEWDTSIDDYKPDWVRVHEHMLEPGDTGFVQATLDEYGADIRALRRRFQALRPEELRRVKGLPDGDELDLDRAIAARVGMRAGQLPDDRIYARHVRNRRDVAVAFLVDLSSSTNEVAGEGNRRIIQVEKEALVMIAEAVDAIGDACAIYGFSGYGREHVAFYVAKDFKDPYDDTVRERIGRMSWKMENRDGAAIRHATAKLLSHRARTRLLILLSDGRPLDCGCDHYYDRYAHEDTRVALREARNAGVHPFCITVDQRARAYLEDLYGEVGYLVIDQAELLPERLPNVYRRLTR